MDFDFTFIYIYIYSIYLTWLCIVSKDGYFGLPITVRSKQASMLTFVEGTNHTQPQKYFSNTLKLLPQREMQSFETFRTTDGITASYINYLILLSRLYLSLFIPSISLSFLSVLFRFCSFLSFFLWIGLFSLSLS